MPMVKIEIAKDGEFTMDYEGFQGSDCRLKEARLKELLKELDMMKTSEIDKKIVDSRFELEKA